jgi:hypothetical protein
MELNKIKKIIINQPMQISAMILGIHLFGCDQIYEFFNCVQASLRTSLQDEMRCLQFLHRQIRYAALERDHARGRNYLIIRCLEIQAGDRYFGKPAGYICFVDDIEPMA